MKAVIMGWVLATIAGICALGVSALVLLNINELPYAGAMFALAVLVISWFPFVVSCLQAKKEWDYYCWRELMKQKRRRRYTN